MPQRTSTRPKTGPRGAPEPPEGGSSERTHAMASDEAAGCHPDPAGGSAADPPADAPSSRPCIAPHPGLPAPFGGLPPAMAENSRTGGKPPSFPSLPPSPNLHALGTSFPRDRLARVTTAALPQVTLRERAALLSRSERTVSPQARRALGQMPQMAKRVIVLRIGPAALRYPRQLPAGQIAIRRVTPHQPRLHKPL